jgi:hypothetical protein
MSTPSRREYEFTQQQNSAFSGLASHMRGVGLFLIFIAVLDFLVALLVVVTIYRARLPQSYVDKVLEKVSEATQKDVKAQLENVPPDTHLWGIAISSGVNGLIYLLIGVWTRNAAASFQKIVDTTGSDIHHLMDAVSSLDKMYGLIYTLIVVGLVLLLALIGLALWGHFSR